MFASYQVAYFFEACRKENKGSLKHSGKNIRLYGAGGHSQVIKDLVESNGSKILITYDDHPAGRHHASEEVVMGARADIANFPHQGDPMIIAVGDNMERAEIAKFLKSDFATAIHYSAVISSDVQIGMGTMVYAGAIIQPNTVIGKHVIINTGASVDHDNIIDDFVHISPKVALCGHVEIGKGTHVGAAAVVIPKVKIGKWCIIGAGTVVISDIPDYSVAVGNPGRVIKKLAKHEK